MAIFRDKQYQRKANLFEKVLTGMQIPNNIMAGGFEALSRGDNPVLGAKQYMKEHKTWQDVLEGQGADGWQGTIGGFALDIFTDPTTYIGGLGLTKAGKLARATSVVEKISQMPHVGEAARAAVGVEEFGTTLAEQAARKQRALISFAGKPVIYGEKVFALAEGVGKRVGNTTAGRTFSEMFMTMPGAPEAIKLRDRMRRSAISRDIKNLEGMLTGEGSQYYDEMVKAGVDAEDAKHILRDSVELTGKYIGKEDLTKHMDKNMGARYVGWVREAETVKRGGSTEISEFSLNQFRFPKRGGQRRTPTIGKDTAASPTSTVREELVSLEDEAAALGRKKPIRGRTPRNASGINVRGNEAKMAGHFNPHGFPDSWDFAGQMPAELLQHLPENTRRAVRRAEQTAIANWSAKKTGRVVNEVLKKYAGPDVIKMHPTVQRAVNFINASNAAFLGNERATGIRVTELVSDVNYLRHALTPEARDLLLLSDRGNAFANSYDVSVRFGAQLQRDEKLRNLTITEINELAEAGKLNILGNRKAKLFEDEAFHATFIRGSESIKSIESAKMVQDSFAAYGKKLTGTLESPITRKDVPEGFEVLSDRLALDMGVRQMDKGRVVSDIALPSDIARVLEHHYERIITPDYMQPLLRGYDALQRIWKNTLLPIWPAYQSRNAISDLTLMTALGADDYGVGINHAVGGIAEVSMGLTGHSKGKLINIGATDVPWEEFKGMLEHFGMIDYTIGRDLDEGISRTFGLPRDLPKVQKVEEAIQMMGWGKFRPIDMGIRASTFRQNAMNAGYFLALLRDGHAPEIAALEVKKRLFDFQELTDVERQILRRMIPFYSWLRHNIPYQIGASIKRPGILANVQKSREAFSGGEGPAGETPLPSFLSGGMPMMFNTGLDPDPNKPEFVRLQGLLPVGDLSLLDNPIELVANQMSPFLKAPYEIARNTSLFEQEPLERFPGDATKRWGITVNKRWTPAIDMWRPIKEVDQAFFKDNPLGSKIAGLAVAKDYPIDVKLQQGLMQFRLKQAEVEAKKMMFKAAQRGDTANVVRIRQWLKTLHDNPSLALQ